MLLKYRVFYFGTMQTNCTTFHYACNLHQHVKRYQNINTILYVLPYGTLVLELLHVFVILFLFGKIKMNLPQIYMY